MAESHVVYFADKIYSSMNYYLKLANPKVSAKLSYFVDFKLHVQYNIYEIQKPE